MKDNELQGKIRLDILEAAHGAGRVGAHIAPSLSMVELVAASLMHMGPEDRFVLSKGHGALGYYAAMHQLGMLSDEEFQSFEKDGGEYPGQPSRSEHNKVVYSSGSLGMGLSYAAGLACASRDSVIFTLMGDGELNEGSVWEAASLSSKLKLINLVALVDNNNLQSDGFCNEVLDMDIPKIWTAYGWNVIECDGNSIKEISSAIENRSGEKPTVIIGRTTKGKGVSFMENDNQWHHNVLKDEDYEKAVMEIKQNYGLHQE